MKNSFHRLTQREERMENHWRVSKNCKIFKEDMHVDYGNIRTKKIWKERRRTNVQSSKE
jgi:hypothetical protein